MAEKSLKTRIVHKHDIEANWLLATGFTPKQGEIIVYDIDDNYSYERIKIGDGVQNVNDLPFAVMHSDWNINDENDAGYIKNRTHYTVHRELLTSIEMSVENTFSYSVDDIDSVNIICGFVDNGNNIMDVFIDGTLYQCQALFTNGNYYINLDGATTTGQGLHIYIGGSEANMIYLYPDSFGLDMSAETRMVEIYTPEIVQQLDERYIPDTIARISDQAQSDWNVDDETSPAYIKNRPFYIESEFSTFVEQQEVVIGSDLYAQLAATNMPFVVGQTYTVNFNGAQYECTAWAGSGKSICIGNGDIYAGAGLGGDEPFCCDSYLDGTVYLNTSAQGSYTIAISGYIQVVHKIDNKYLPDMIGAKGTEKGAEVFNDYEYNEASGMYSHAEGANTVSSSYATHAEGNCTISSGMYGSHAEGDHTVASHGGAHSEGYYTKAVANNAHAEGKATIASGQNAHSEGEYTVASGKGAHAEGLYQSLFVINLTGAKNALTYEIAGGLNATTYKDILYRDVVIYYNYPVRCTNLTIENNVITHITVDQTINPVSDLTNAAANVYIGSLASGEGSHAEGMATIAASQYQHVQGKYNKADTSNKYAHIVGNGTAATSRSNAHTVDWSGNAWFAGDIRVGGTSYDNAISILPKITTVTLNADSWTGDANPWSQVVTINGVTDNSKVDLQPTAVQIVALQDAEITLMLQNDNGIITAWAIGNKPTEDYTMQVLITEVVHV